ncbi:MAG: hypothetical protein ACKV2T_17925 [Kofleriaceae bacterium]
MRWFALVVLAAACGDNLRAFESGSRLEAIVDVGGDDAVAIAYYRDTERGVDCQFQRDARSEWRCLPRARVELAGYSDDACSVPIYECRDCTAPQAVLLEAGCGGAVATPVALVETTRPLFIRVGELCLHAEYPPGDYYTTESQPLDGYIGATFEDHLVTYQLGTRTLVADDGTREMFHHAYERGGARDCSFGGGMVEPCLPGTRGSTEGQAFYFEDAACSSRAAFSVKPNDPRSCPPPTHVRFEGGVHRVTSIGDRAFERSPIDSSCVSTEGAELAFYAIGAVDESLPRAEAISVGTGDARPVYHAAEGMPIAFAHRWIDAADATLCTPLATVAGRRCIGRSLSLFGSDIRYGDVACSVELAPNPDGALYALRWEGVTVPREVSARSTVASIHALRSYPATEMYEMRDGFCALSPEPVVLMAFVGAPLDLQTFPSVEQRPAR